MFREQHGATLTDGLTTTVAAALAGDFSQATTAVQQVVDGGRHLLRSVVRDALAGGLDWWAIGELLNLHPQAAFDAYANLTDGTRTPAQQRPPLAVVCTAGLASEHDMLGEYGIDLDDLDPEHSLIGDPTVARLREALALNAEDSADDENDEDEDLEPLR